MTVTLERKRPAHLVPSYSLTGDLLSFLRCGLQYRYYNGSSLPPSRPVQLWYGEFIHGVLEACVRFWKEANPKPAFPWPCNPKPWNSDPPAWVAHDIGRFAHRVETSLRAQGKFARSADTREAAYRRAEAAVNLLGPHLFPLVRNTETKVIGTRSIAAAPGGIQLRAERYEVHGVIDVLTHLDLTGVVEDNIFRRAVLAACNALPNAFEIIIDYKGARRPPTDDPYWKQGDWQVQTYAWLRQQQTEQVPVAAGILIYVNELIPGDEEIKAIQAAMLNGSSDIVPAQNSKEALAIRNWRSGHATNFLPLELRLQRAIRVIPVTARSLIAATSEFDVVVRDIEISAFREAEANTIEGSWQASCDDEGTCVACDFRHICPQPAPAKAQHVVVAPVAP